MIRKATSKDVADLVGVSRSAVSLVLNGRGAGNIAPDKQQAIIDAARELDYTPNSVALSLRTRRTNTIGIVTDAIATSAYGGQVLRGAADAAKSAGYAVMLIDTGAHDEQSETAFQTLLNRQVDGLVYAAMGLRSVDAPDSMLTHPSVLANCYETTGRVSSTSPDEFSGGRQAAQLLLDEGHRNIRLLGGTPDVPAATLRQDGYLAAMADADLPAAAPLVAGWTIDDGYQCAMATLTGPDRPTGVLCANDRVAVGVVLAAARLGLDVPGDLSVVGYDDDENVARAMQPKLTTIALPHRQMGERAVEMLLERLDGAAERRPSQVLLPCPAIIRDSVAAPPASTRPPRRGGRPPAKLRED